VVYLKTPADREAFIPPKHEIEAFARCILPAIRKYFESEQGQREFAEWKANKDLEKKQSG
jgi:hypothetical protein